MPCWARGPRTPSRTTDSKIDCAFFENALLFVALKIGRACPPVQPPLPVCDLTCNLTASGLSWNTTRPRLKNCTWWKPRSPTWMSVAQIAMPVTPIVTWVTTWEGTSGNGWRRKWESTRTPSTKFIKNSRERSLPDTRNYREIFKASSNIPQK